MNEPPLDDESEEKIREATDHRDAGRLARDEALRRTARAFLAAVAASAMRSRTVVSPHAIHLGASLLVDHAAGEANRPTGQR